MRNRSTLLILFTRFLQIRELAILSKYKFCIFLHDRYIMFIYMELKDRQFDNSFYMNGMRELREALLFNTYVRYLEVAKVCRFDNQ